MKGEKNANYHFGTLRHPFLYRIPAEHVSKKKKLNLKYIDGMFDNPHINKRYHYIQTLIYYQLSYEREHPDLNWGHFDLQSNALPLSYTPYISISLYPYTSIYVINHDFFEILNQFIQCHVVFGFIL